MGSIQGDNPNMCDMQVGGHVRKCTEWWDDEVNFDEIYRKQ